MLKYIIGYFAFKFYNARLYYIQSKNKCVAGGGKLTGNVDVSCPENVFVGEGSYVNGGCLSASPNGHITIGKNCLISYNVHFRTDMHVYTNGNVCINKQGHIEKDIVVGDDVWIGYGVQIMAGVHIADGCVIGAGAVVTHNTEPYGVYVGVPAKLVKMRNVNAN